MRRKILQDFANTLCAMVVGWRMGDDLELIAELPDGSLTFDILCGTVRHSSGAAPVLWVAGELKAWLQQRCQEENIDIGLIVQAELIAKFDTTRIRTDRKRIISFDWKCQSIIRTDETTYQGTLNDMHAWHSRKPAA